MTKVAKIGTVGTGPFNLGPRLMLTFATLIALILGGNALVVFQFYTARNETDRLTGANQQLIAVLGLQADLLSLHRRLDDLARSMDVRRLVTETASLRGALQEQTRQTRTAIANLPSGTVVDPSFLPTLDTIDVALPSEIEAILELAKLGDWRAIQPRVANELSPIETQTAILVNSINRQASGELTRGVAKMSSVQRRILIIVPATALSTFFIAAFFGWSIARRFIELRLDERVAERTRIARELHDTLLQNLHGLLFRFQAARNLFPRRPEEAMEVLDQAIGKAEQAITESQDAITDLRPSPAASSDLAGLLMATGKELETTGNTNGRAATFALTLEGERRSLYPTMQDEVYRIALELLRNAFRHACARRVEAEVRFDDEQLRVRIRDDGKGMDPEVLKTGRRPGHWGLLGAKERAQRIGAHVDIWSEAGAGTEIQISVPATLAYRDSHNRPKFKFFRGVRS